MGGWVDQTSCIGYNGIERFGNEIEDFFYFNCVLRMYSDVLLDSSAHKDSQETKPDKKKKVMMKW